MIIYPKAVVWFLFSLSYIAGDGDDVSSRLTLLSLSVEIELIKMNGGWWGSMRDWGKKESKRMNKLKKERKEKKGKKKKESAVSGGTTNSWLFFLWLVAVC